MEDLSRLVPEAGVLIITLGFIYRLGKDIFIPLKNSIEANTQATQEVKEYLQKRNGSLERNDKEIVQLIEKMHKKLAIE